MKDVSDLRWLLMHGAGILFLGFLGYPVFRGLGLDPPFAFVAVGLSMCGYVLLVTVLFKGSALREELRSLRASRKP